MAVLNSAIMGEKDQPSVEELNRIGKDLRTKHWSEIFAGAAAVKVVADGAGPALSIRLTKGQGPPLQIVPEGTPGAFTVAVKRVNELDFYNLGAKDLARKIGLTQPKTLAIVDHLHMRDDASCYKEFRIGRTRHKRYSQKAIGRLKEALEGESIDNIWKKRQESIKNRRRSMTTVTETNIEQEVLVSPN